MTPVQHRSPGMPIQRPWANLILGLFDTRETDQFNIVESHPSLSRIHAAIKLTVPDRPTLISRLLSKGNSNEIDGLSIDIVESCNTIERVTQELFEMHNLTKLTWSSSDSFWRCARLLFWCADTIPLALLPYPWLLMGLQSIQMMNVYFSLCRPKLLIPAKWNKSTWSSRLLPTDAWEQIVLMPGYERHFHFNLR